MITNTPFHFNDDASVLGRGMVPSSTFLAVRNRARGEDAFGLLSIVGRLMNANDSDLTLEVRFGGHERTLTGIDAFGPLTDDGNLAVEFHLMTHLVTDGYHPIEAVAIMSDGTRVEFPVLELNIRNDSALARKVAQDLREYGTPAIVGSSIDSTLFPYSSGTARAWFDADIDDDIPMSLEPAADDAMAQRHLLRWGFCVLQEQLPPTLVDQLKHELSTAIGKGELTWRPGSSDRIHGAHEKLPSARAVWLYPAVLRFLEAYYKDTPCACQTLTYVNGSEQNAHQDSIHLTPYPNGFMCGVWVALEDVREDSGELFVYPGSHKAGSLRASPLGLHKIVNEDYSHYTVFDREILSLIEENGYQRVVYRPKAGQILIWHENLIHGGSPRVDHDRTRLSVVSHYFARGAIGFYDSRGEAAGLETLDSY